MLKFVGGPWDGQIKRVDDERETIMVPEKTKLLPSIYHGANETKIFRYQRMDFMGSEHRFSLFVVGDLDADAVFQKLIDSYGGTHD